MDTKTLLIEASYEEMVEELRRRRRENPEPFQAKIGETLHEWMLRNAPPLPDGPGIYLAAAGDPFRDAPGFEPMLIVIDETRILQIFDDGSFGQYELNPETEDEVRCPVVEFRQLTLDAFRAAWVAALQKDT